MGDQRNDEVNKGLPPDGFMSGIARTGRRRKEKNAWYALRRLALLQN